MTLTTPATGAAPVTRQDFLDAMSRHAASVSIVATDGPEGRDGVVVSTLTPVSADTPRPSLLICLNRSGRVPPRLLANGAFTVSLLADDQLAVAERFAGRDGTPRDRWFDGDDWTTTATGLPILATALAGFDCEVLETSLVGTHYVIFGAVRAISLRAEGTPLVHAQRRFRRLME